MVANPQQLAQQYKSVLQSSGYTVMPDGTVRDRTGAAIPPWSWAQSVPELQNQKVNVQGSQISPYVLPPGFGESAWSGMAQSNGPFSKPAAWDPQTGTYQSDTDWGTLLGTAAVGGLFAAPAVAGALSAGGGTAAATGAGATGAGGTAAGTAGGAGVAGTSAASGAGWFSPSAIIPSAIQGVATLFGANQQANANKEGAQLQYQATEDALKDARDQRAYQQQQYASYLGRLQPYLSLGTNAGSTLQNLLARSPYTQMANSGPLPQYSTAPQGPGSSMAAQPNQTGMPSASPSPSAADIQTLQSKMGGNTGFTGGAPVMLRAPDGSTKSVDPSMVNHYLSLGAVQV